jgi:hypothetical protein
MSSSAADDAPPVRPEASWPALAAVVAVLLLTLLRPPEMRVAPVWVLPTLEIGLLAALMASHPPRSGPRVRRWRAISIALVGVVVADTLAATARLIEVLIKGGHATNSASGLLAAGGIVWFSNVFAFALLYWLLDGGGVAARTVRMPDAPDLAFPQQLNPDLAPPEWRPRFYDYVYLAVTTSTAFSPTDVMPLRAWAKLAMGVESLVSLAVLGLVVARAVNVFT